MALWQKKLRFVLKINMEISSNKFNGLELHVVLDQEEIIAHETRRVSDYLPRIDYYRNAGYNLRIPSDLVGLSGTELATKIDQYVERERDAYSTFAEKYTAAFDRITASGAASVASKLYGIHVSESVTLVPTQFGTMASPLDILSDKPFFIRMDKFIDEPPVLSNGKDRTPEERLVHEIFAHGLTAPYRSGTILDDRMTNAINVRPKCKERLMDLLGRSILIRTGLIKHNDIAMQVKIVGDAPSVVDPAYYVDVIRADDGGIKFDGNIGDIVGNVIEAVGRSEKLNL